MNNAASNTLVLWCRVAEITGAVLEAAERDLSPTDRVRADQFVRSEDHMMFVASRWLMGVALAECGLCATLHSTAGSKPVLIGLQAEGREVSLSHGGGWVAVAVAQEGSVGVGVDVEHAGREIDALALAPAVVDPAEIRMLNQLGPGARRLRFLHGWTLREAWAKALGEGLSADLASVRMAPDGRLVSVPANAAWTLQLACPEPDLLLAVAVYHPTTSSASVLWGRAVFGGDGLRIAHTAISPVAANRS